MKLNYIKKSIIPALAVVFSLSSCLKDDNANLDFESVSGKTYVGIADPSPSSATFNSTSFAVISSATESTIQLSLTYISTTDNPGTDVTIKVETDKKIIDTYNTARSTSYQQLAPANYSLPNTKITIPAGQKSVQFPVIIKPSTITNTSAAYALPIVITDASGKEISGNYGTHMVLVTIKNPWDGIYAATGTFTHPVSGVRTIDEEKGLATVDPTTVSSTLGDLGEDYVVTLKVDASNKVTVTSEDFELSVPAGKANTYDPDTKTFHLNYQYSGTGGFRVIQEDLKYVKVR